MTTVTTAPRPAASGARKPRAACCSPPNPCPACRKQRAELERLVHHEGLLVTVAAARLCLSPARAARILEEEADRRSMTQMRDEFADQMREAVAVEALDQIVASLAAVTGPNRLAACWARTVAAGRAGLPFTSRELASLERMTHIPNGPLRARIEQALRDDEDLTLNEIADRAGMDFSYVKRVLGIVATSGRVRNGRFYAGRRQKVVAVDTAAAIARAAEIPPSEIPGL